MFKYTPCEPEAKMLGCCRSFRPVVLFLFLSLCVLSVVSECKTFANIFTIIYYMIIVLVLMLCCICPPWRVLCECFLCSRCCAIDENGNFINFQEDEEHSVDEVKIRTEDDTVVSTMTKTGIFLSYPLI
ncbi:unnamed protein product [Thelazia callipaeda]|uniref:LITAF domain-containing protein n=1 Tax=Thelazia callipaeda TaxID=103827 RepID=A0A0N5CJT2_THECL|nr:unnamed protein product [Thelazia callipaeda]